MRHDALYTQPLRETGAGSWLSEEYGAALAQIGAHWPDHPDRIYRLLSGIEWLAPPLTESQRIQLSRIAMELRSIVGWPNEWWSSDYRDMRFALSRLFSSNLGLGDGRFKFSREVADAVVGEPWTETKLEFIDWALPIGGSADARGWLNEVAPSALGTLDDRLFGDGIQAGSLVRDAFRWLHLKQYLGGASDADIERVRGVIRKALSDSTTVVDVAQSMLVLRVGPDDRAKVALAADSLLPAAEFVELLAQHQTDLLPPELVDAMERWRDESPR